jgi:hypothetical protein
MHGSAMLGFNGRLMDAVHLIKQALYWTAPFNYEFSDDESMGRV